MPALQTNTGLVNLNYSQAFPTGTSFSLEVDNNRQTSNSIFNSLNPTLNSFYRITIQQQLLAGFGTGPNLRYLRIARNNKKISDIAFKSQIIATVTQIADIYWDLVSAYQEEKVNEQSYAFAQQSLDNAKKQLQLEAIPAMDVMRAEAEVSRRDQDLTVAKTTLQLQESLIKNALTKNLDDPTLEAMPVIPTDTLETVQEIPEQPTQDLIAQALLDRPELVGVGHRSAEPRDHPQSRRAMRLLPTLTLVGFYGSSGLAGRLNPLFTGAQSAAGSDQLVRRVSGCLEQLVARLPGRTEPECSHSQSRGQGRPVPLRAGVSPGGTARAATEEADSHRSTQRRVCSGTGPRARGGGAARRAIWRRRRLPSCRRNSSWARDRASRL